MQSSAEEVCRLQKDWTAKNTDVMERRGLLIRHEIPEWISDGLAELSAHMNVVGSDLFAEGRDGTGQKTEVPWARFGSKSRSPSAQQGWYCVYLFEATGEGFYLALAHGSTTFIDGEFRAKPDSEIAEFMGYARRILGAEIGAHPSYALPIALNARRSKLGGAYERTTVLAKWYDANDLPTDEIFRADARQFAGFLKKLYEAEDLGRQIGTEPPEFVAVRDIIQPASRGVAQGGQGRGLTVEERRVVERHAMERARMLLEGEGFHVRDVSGTHSYDFEAHRDGDLFLVEVKGTTSLGEKILLTANEVAIQKTAYPLNGLIVVHSIDLNRTASPVTANGGEILFLRPWKIDDEALAPTAYAYVLGSS